MARNPVISRGSRGITRSGAQYLQDPSLIQKDLLKAHRSAIRILGREITIFLRKYGLATRGVTIIDQPAYRNKLGKQAKNMYPDCHGAILAVDNDTSDMLAILTGKGAGPGIRKIIAKHYADDPAKKVKTKILLRLLKERFFNLLSERGFSWKPLIKKQFVPNDPHHYKGEVYRVLPLWVINLKSTGTKVIKRRPRRRRRRLLQALQEARAEH